MSLSFVYLISPRTICVKRKTDPFIAFAPINDKQNKAKSESMNQSCVGVYYLQSGIVSCW